MVPKDFDVSALMEHVPPREAGLAEFLSDLRGSKVEVRAAQRGEKRRLAELAFPQSQRPLPDFRFQLHRVEAYFFCIRIKLKCHTYRIAEFFKLSAAGEWQLQPADDFDALDLLVVENNFFQRERIELQIEQRQKRQQRRDLRVGESASREADDFELGRRQCLPARRRTLALSTTTLGVGDGLFERLERQAHLRSRVARAGPAHQRVQFPP